MQAPYANTNFYIQLISKH